MSVAAVEADADRKLVGKSKLCASLRWSRERLDRFLEAHPDFPFVQRGSKGIAWQFDLDEALAFVARAKAEDEKQVAEMTPRARRELATAEAIERKNRLAARKLIEAPPFRDDLALMLARLGKSLDELPLEIVKRLGLPSGAHKVIQELIDERRRLMIADMDQYLADEDEGDGEDE